MGIPVEFNPELALRNISEWKAEKRKIEECIPEELEVGKIYDFLKKEQRIYHLRGPISLIETTAQGGLFSKSHANVRLLEVVHFFENDEVYTRGRYEVLEVFPIDVNQQFEKCNFAK